MDAPIFVVVLVIAGIVLIALAFLSLLRKKPTAVDEEESESDYHEPEFPDPEEESPPPQPKKPAQEPPELAALMPFLGDLGGTAGTATAAQIRDIDTLAMGALPPLSEEQAHAVVNAWAYAEGIIYPIIGRVSFYDGERFIEASLVDYILRDATLRDHVIAWDKWAPGRGSDNVPIPPRDVHYGQVEREAMRLFDTMNY